MLHGQINRHSCFNDDLHFHRAESCLSKIFSRSAEMSFDVSTQNGLQVMVYSIFIYCINTYTSDSKNKLYGTHTLINIYVYILTA